MEHFTVAKKLNGDVWNVKKNIAEIIWESFVLSVKKEYIANIVTKKIISVNFVF